MRYSEIQKKREPVSSCHDLIRADKGRKAVLWKNSFLYACL